MVGKMKKETDEEFVARHTVAVEDLPDADAAFFAAFFSGRIREAAEICRDNHSKGAWGKRRVVEVDRPLVLEDPNHPTPQHRPWKGMATDDLNRMVAEARKVRPVTVEVRKRKRFSVGG